MLCSISFATCVRQRYRFALFLFHELRWSSSVYLDPNYIFPALRLLDIWCSCAATERPLRQWQHTGSPYVCKLFVNWGSVAAFSMFILKLWAVWLCLFWKMFIIHIVWNEEEAAKKSNNIDIVDINTKRHEIAESNKELNCVS